MEFKTKALCLRTADYKENDKLLTLATPENGKLVAQIRSVKSPKSKLKIAASQMCFGEYILNKKNNRYSVIGCTVEDSFFNCWEDVPKYTAAQIVLEVVDGVTEEGLECGAELALALHALSAINYAEVNPYVVACWALVRLLPSQGVDVESIVELPSKVAGLFRTLADCQTTDELDSLQIELTELVRALTYVNLIYKNQLGERLKSLPIALKLLNTD